MPQNDVVIDADRMCRYGMVGAGSLSRMFDWLNCCGGLCVSQHLVVEYGRQGSPFVAALLGRLISSGRLSKINKETIAAFGIEDRHYRYRCNADDIPNARLVFRSFRKLLISNDEKLRNDVNGFGVVNGILPRAFASMPPDAMVACANRPCPASVHS